MAQLTQSLGDTGNGTPDQLLESLGRLSKKSGVLATIILDRVSGAILKSTGSILIPHNSVVVTATVPIVGATSSTSDDVVAGAENISGIEQMAAMVWNFVSSTTGLVNGFDGEDELKLLRLRTKKYELVIVPDSKYLLVVVHDTPST